MILKAREYNVNEKRRIICIDVSEEYVNALKILIDQLERPNKYTCHLEINENGATCKLRYYSNKDFSRIREYIESYIVH